MRNIIIGLMLISMGLLKGQGNPVAASVQLAGGDNAWHAARPTATPLPRQVVLNTSTGQYKIGDGVTQLQNLPYIGINGTGFVKSTGTVISYDPSTYLTTEVDGSITNELQTLSRSGQTISLTSGGSVTVQPPLNGTGFVVATGTNISYDNSTYLTTTNGVPYVGANSFTTSNNITAGSLISTGPSTLNSLTINGGSSGLASLKMFTQAAVSSPTNGNIWLESEATNGWVHYLNDPTNSGYHSVWKNASTGMALYLANAGGSPVQLGSSTNVAFALNVNGGSPKIRISAAGNVGINTTQDVASTFSVAGDVGINTTATVTGAFLANSTATVTGNLRASSNASVFGNLSTTGTCSVGSNFTVTGNSLLTGTVQASSSITAAGVIESTSTRGWVLGELAGKARIGYFSGEFQCATVSNTDADFRAGKIRSTSGYSLSAGGYSVNTKVIDATAGDAVTINSPIGQFRKDATGTTFVLTNSQITANSVIMLTPANAAIDATAIGWTISKGAGSATITFNLAPTANFDMMFMIMN